MSWQFINPEAFYWALVPSVIAAYFLLGKRKSKTLTAFSKAAVEKQSKKTKQVFRALFVLFTLGLMLLTLAAARPVLRLSWTEKSSEGIDLVFTLDVSESMDADDFRPSRIRVAKDMVSDFIRKRESDRIAFNVFAGESVTKSPLTRDHEFVLNQVEGIELRELKQGTAIGMGLMNAILRLKGSESKTKIIVLLTDGDSNVGSINPISAALLAKQEGIKIYTIGMGQKNRVIIPIYQYDDQGRKGPLMARIPSYLNPALLREVAAITGGQSYMARDSGMLNRILQEIDSLERTRIRMLPKQKQEEKFFWPAALALLLLFVTSLLLETRYRKGVATHVLSA
jgi:Ca-activated chloride channel homolog